MDLRVFEDELPVSALLWRDFLNFAHSVVRRTVDRSAALGSGRGGSSNLPEAQVPRPEPRTLTPRVGLQRWVLPRGGSEAHFLLDPELTGRLHHLGPS